MSDKIAEINETIAKHHEATANIKCRDCNSSDVSRGADITGCFSCGKLYKHDQLCCAAPDIVQDELGLSCANCGHSVNAATLTVSSPAAPLVQLEDDSDTAPATPDPYSTSEITLPCCGISMSFAEIHDNSVHCLHCEQFHSITDILDHASDKKDDDETYKQPIDMSCCKEPWAVREHKLPRKPNSLLDDEVATPQPITVTRCVNCDTVYMTAESAAREFREAAFISPDWLEDEVITASEEDIEQFSKGYDASEDPQLLWKFGEDEPVVFKDEPKKVDGIWTMTGETFSKLHEARETQRRIVDRRQRDVRKCARRYADTTDDNIGDRAELVEKCTRDRSKPAHQVSHDWRDVDVQAPTAMQVSLFMGFRGRQGLQEDEITSPQSKTSVSESAANNNLKLESAVDKSIGSESATLIDIEPELAAESDIKPGIIGDRTFTLFSNFPTEIREHIYKIILQSDRAISPHLCGDNPNADIRFHDKNQVKHNAVYQSMQITRVSRKVRAESLPVFYSVNTFEVGADTPTYLLRLQHLGRFNMIHNVSFVLPFWNNPDYSQKILRMLLQNFAEQERYEKASSAQRQVWQGVVAPVAAGVVEKAIGFTVKENPKASQGASRVAQYEQEPSKFYTEDLRVLKSHPFHIMGGLEPGFLVLRMLSTAFQGGDYNRKLVIHVPAAQLFDEYNGLLYFPAVCEGLGIQLKFVSGREVELTGGGFRLSWHQKYQKKDFTDTTTAESGKAEYKVLTKRVQTLYPNIEQVPRPTKRTYYRRSCKSDRVEWFSVHTEGGGL